MKMAIEYGGGAIAFHWATVVLVVVVGALGLLHDSWPDRTEAFWINLHAVIGPFLWLLIIGRAACVRGCLASVLSARWCVGKNVAAVVEVNDRFVALIVLLCVPLLARAQANYEIQVYGAETVPPHTLMAELHSNFTVEGQKSTLDGVYPTDHQEHETVELTEGLNDWSEIGLYLFASEQNGHGVQWVGDHIRPRIRVPDSWAWPVGVSLSTEIGFQRSAYSSDTWTWEIRPIIDKIVGRWYFAINPALERTLHGPDVNQGWDFAPGAKISYDFTRVVSGGIEWYANYGAISNIAPIHSQQQQVFVVTDLSVSPLWEINFGIGFGGTAVTDHLIVKAILGRRFNWDRHTPID